MPEKTKSRWLPACLRMHECLWRTSLRTILMGVFFLCLAYASAMSPRMSLERVGYEAYHGELIFITIYRGFGVEVCALALLMVFSEIPRRVAYQQFALQRTSRMKWLASLVLFTVLLTVMMLAVLTLFAVACTATYASPGSGWSDNVRLAADPDYIYEPQLVVPYVREMTPLTASLLAMAVVFMFFLTVALALLAFSLFNATDAGVLLLAFLLFLSVTLLYEYLPFTIVMPTQLASLQGLGNVFRGHEIEGAIKTCAGYAVADVALLALMAVRVQRMDFQFTNKD